MHLQGLCDVWQPFLGLWEVITPFLSLMKDGIFVCTVFAPLICDDRKVTSVGAGAFLK